MTKKYNIFTYVCAAILLVQCILIAFCNVTLGPDNIDCDSAKLYVHAIEMVKNHNYIISDWSIITTLELDCSLLFAVPIFALCKDIYISFGIANMLMVFIFIGVIFLLFSGKDKIYPLLCCDFILIPYGIGQLDYFNMMFFNGSQYVMKVLIAILLISILVHTVDKKITRSGYIFLGILYSLFLLVSAVSSGIYIIAVAVFPIFVGYIVWHLHSRRKIPFSYWVWGAWSGVLSLIGLIGNRKLALGAKGNSMTLCSVKELHENISACFWGIFELFRGVAYKNVRVMSIGGIKVLLHMAFVLILLGCVIGGVKKILKKDAKIEVVLLMSVFLWNTFVLCICQTKYGASTFEYRYHLIGMIPVICVGVISVLEWYEKETKQWKNGIAMVLVAMIIILNTSSFRDVFQKEGAREYYQLLAEWITEEGYEYAYFYNDSATSEILRLLDYKNEDIIYLAVNQEGNTIVYDYYSKYINQPMVSEKSVLVIMDMYDDKIEFCGREYTKRNTIGIMSFYE